MLLRIEPEPDETLRACGALARAAASPLPPSSAGWILVLAYVATGAVAYALAVADWLLVAVLAALGVLLAWLGLQLEARWRGRRLLALDPHARESHQLELTEAGIRQWCAHVDYRVTWDAITRVHETGEFYLLVRGASGGVAIPRRILTDGEDRQLRESIARWAPADAVHLAREPAAARPVTTT